MIPNQEEEKTETRECIDIRPQNSSAFDLNRINRCPQTNRITQNEEKKKQRKKIAKSREVKLRAFG